MQDLGTRGVIGPDVVQKADQLVERRLPDALEPVVHRRSPHADDASGGLPPPCALDQLRQHILQRHSAPRTRFVINLPRVRILVKRADREIRYVRSMKTAIEQLRQTRIERGWTTRELAARLDVSQAAISAWERGAREPTWEMLERWSAALGVHLRLSVDKPTARPPTAPEEAAALIASLDEGTAQLLLAQLRAASALKTGTGG